MSTATARPVYTPTGRDLSFGGVLRSEWIKLRSLRSTWWCFTILAVLIVGFALLTSSFVPVEETPGMDPQANALRTVTAGSTFGALVVSVLGVLIISGEYGTGMIRSTLVAVPRRLPALAAKAIVFALATLVMAAVSYAVATGVSVAVLGGRGYDVDLGDSQYWLAIAGSVAYLVLIGLIALAIGAIIRNTGGGIAGVLGLILAAPIVLSIIAALVQLAWLSNLALFLPAGAGSALSSYPEDNALIEAREAGGLWTLEPWQGGLALVVWVAVLLTTAAVLLKRRDA